MREITVSQQEFEVARRIYTEIAISPFGTFRTTVEGKFNGIKYGGTVNSNNVRGPYGLWRRSDNNAVLWHFEFYSKNPLSQPHGLFDGDEERFRLDMATVKIFIK